LNGFPFSRGGRPVDGDPVAVGVVGFVELFVKSSGVIGGCRRHLDYLSRRT
jgi:hypothetical protein